MGALRQRGWGVSSSTDADLADGGRYVVGASADFGTSACSITDVVRGHAVSGRPTSVREPTTAGSEGAGPPASAVEWLARVAGGIAGLFLLVYAAGALRRRRLALSRGAGAVRDAALSSIDNIDQR